MMPLTEATKPNTVYKYYDRLGRLIYIGSTVRGGKRQDEHATTSPWFRQHAAIQDLETCRDREEMLRVERELIRIYRPPFNKVHNENWEAIRAAYLTIVTAEESYGKVQAGQPLARTCNPCGEGSATCLYGQSQSRDFCGSPDCHICHANFHGCQEGYNRGIEEGIVDSERRAARLAQAAEGRRCGHCSGCLEEVDPWSDEDPYCEALNSGDCETCGKTDCLFVAGESEGSVEGYMQGCDWGEKLAVTRYERSWGGDFKAANYLMWQSQRLHLNGPLIIPEDDRDAALGLLIQAERDGSFNRLVDEAVAGREGLTF